MWEWEKKLNEFDQNAFDNMVSMAKEVKGIDIDLDCYPMDVLLPNGYNSIPFDKKIELIDYVI